MEIPVVVAAATADSPGGGAAAARPSRYESQKRRDWQTFGHYLRNHRPPLELPRCSGAHVLEFLRYLDQFGKTKVHARGCPFFGLPSPPAPCPCPLRQAWGSLDALVGRLRAAFEEHGAGAPEANPFAARAVRLYLREVRDVQAAARGIAYEKKRRRRHPANKQAKQQQQQQQQVDHQCQQESAAAVSAFVVTHPAMAERRREVPDLAPHFLIPHAHFFHGLGHHYLLPATAQVADDAAEGMVPAVGVTGDDMMLTMTADAHGAAGCMMPLSVFQ